MGTIAQVTVGRGAEIRAVAEVLTQLSAGRGGCLWIEGEAGIGKSHLVGELVGRARGLGHPVLLGHAEQLMRSFPLRAMADALGVAAPNLDSARAVIAALLAGEPVDGVGYADPVLAAAERMISLVEAMCARGPLVLVLEDIHGADEASLALLDRLTGEIGQIPLLLALTTRPSTQAADGPGAAIERRATWRFELEPLGAEHVRELAESRLGAGIGPRLSMLLDTAAGSPLYANEILDQLGPDELAVADGDRVELVADTAVPGRLAAALGWRLDPLDPGSLHVLRLAALLGNGFPAADLALVLAEDPGPALRSAASAGIVEIEDGRVRFRHELTRNVLTGQLPEAIRGGMHDHIARTLAHAHAADSVVAAHLLAAGDAPGAWAARWLADRPESTLYTTPDAYADLLTRATASAAPGQPRAELLQRLMLVSFWLGRDETVIACGAEAIAAAEQNDPDLAARLRIQVMRSLARQRRFDEAVLMVAGAAEDPAASPVWRARATAWMANAQAFVGDPDQVRSIAAAALESATALGDPLGISYAHAALAVVSGVDQMIGHLESALAVLGDEPEELDQHLLVAGNLVIRLGSLGDPGYEPLLEEVLATAERVGTYRTSVLHAHAAGLFFEQGRWDEALLHIAQLGDAALRHPGLAYLSGMRALIAFRRGDAAQGAQILEAAGVPGPEAVADADLGARLIEAAALREESAGRPEQALSVRSRYLGLAASAQRDTRSHEALDLIRLARALGAEDVARQALATVEEVTSAPTADTRLTIEACRAMLARDAAGLRATAAEFLAGGWSYYAAFAFEEAADAALDAGDSPAARADFLRATDIYAKHGADYDVRRATARFRPRGLRRGTRTSARGNRTGWEALTATELRVGGLVAQGYSNTDIARELMISRNTVQTHVSNMLAKLGSRSRTELAREVILRLGEPARTR